MRLNHWIAVLVCALVLPTAATAKERHHKTHKKTHHARSHRSEPAHQQAPKSEPSEPASEPTPPAEPQQQPPAAPAGWDHVDHYAQGAGFGGPLTLARADGTTVMAYFGEKADLECGPTAAGPFAPCPKQNLVDGTPVADAAHGVNQYGYDVWTVIKLVREPLSTG